MHLSGFATNRFHPKMNTRFASQNDFIASQHVERTVKVMTPTGERTAHLVAHKLDNNRGTYAMVWGETLLDPNSEVYYFENGRLIDPSLSTRNNTVKVSTYTELQKQWQGLPNIIGPGWPTP